MTHVIALRFSAMGDVLMTIPVIDSFARQHPDVRVTVVSRPWAQPLFSLLPSNVVFMAADLKGEHAGYHGLNLLARRLFALQPTHIADLHDVLRTKWLRMRLHIAGHHVAHIRKDRRARKTFLSAEVKVPQTSMFEKYVDVFRRLGFDDWSLDFKSLYPQEGADLRRANYQRLPCETTIVEDGTSKRDTSIDWATAAAPDGVPEREGYLPTTNRREGFGAVGEER